MFGGPRSGHTRSRPPSKWLLVQCESSASASKVFSRARRRGEMLTPDLSAPTWIIDVATTWIRLGLDGAGVLVIALGGIKAMASLPKAVRGQQRFTQVRLDFARYLALALEFQLAADVLETAISPSWNQLGILAAIAAIRTLLNFFLAREMDDERTLMAVREGPAPG